MCQGWLAKPPKTCPCRSCRTRRDGPRPSRILASCEKLSPWRALLNIKRHSPCNSEGRVAFRKSTDGRSRMVWTLDQFVSHTWGIRGWVNTTSAGSLSWKINKSFSKNILKIQKHTYLRMLAVILVSDFFFSKNSTQLISQAAFNMEK